MSAFCYLFYYFTFFLNPTFCPSPWRLPSPTDAVVRHLSTMSNTPVNTKFPLPRYYIWNTGQSASLLVTHLYDTETEPLDPPTSLMFSCPIHPHFSPWVYASNVLHYPLLFCCHHSPTSSSSVISFLSPFSRLYVTYLLRMSELPHIPDTFYPAFRICH